MISTLGRHHCRNLQFVNENSSTASSMRTTKVYNADGELVGIWWHDNDHDRKAVQIMLDRMFQLRYQAIQQPCNVPFMAAILRDILNDYKATDHAEVEVTVEIHDA